MLPGRAMVFCLKKLEQMEQRIRSLEDQLKQQDIRNIARAHGQAPSVRSSPANAKPAKDRKDECGWTFGRNRWASIPACVDPRH